MTDDGSVRRAVDAAVAAFGGLDVLVHTAGGDRPEPPFEETGDQLWHDVLDLNLVGTVRCLRAALPHLRDSAHGGNAVLVGSINAELALGSHPYSSAKAGLGILVRNLARRYGPDGVRVNLVQPGTVRTRVWDDQQDDLAALARLYPLGRVGEPEDVAAAICFLASPHASWITGVTLPVDGGLGAGAVGTAP